MTDCHQTLTCRELLERRLAILEDRHGLDFTRYTPFPTIVDALHRSGGVMLRGALPSKELRPRRRNFEQFAETLGRSVAADSAGNEGPGPERATGERRRRRLASTPDRARPGQSAGMTSSMKRRSTGGPRSTKAPGPRVFDIEPMIVVGLTNCLGETCLWQIRLRPQHR